ncbi:MAG: hypothetical protein LBF61_05850 [Azoarcus sp.]|jgi:predicted transposase/invertase (TIGR01784 family)|nr:hypothetical protein [Azoarcus sp.]
MTIAEELERIGLGKELEQGRSEGLEGGRRSASLEIARAMLACGVDFEIVLKTTGLRGEDLVQMRQ